MNIKNKNCVGYTLIEVIVVVSISVIIILGSTALFLTFMIGNGRINLRQEIKANGNNSLNKIQFMLRNAKSISVCHTDLTSLSFQALDGGITTIENSNDRIASISTSVTPDVIYYLTSNEVTLDNLNFDCYQNQNAQYVDVSFSLAKNNSDNSHDIFEESFSSGIMLRNTSF
ncbi:MAG: prepilin-type N-terminal cleavage/methylation domain-containing protein [Patescibacteria group bacterium]|nr:prepilin-type N-terminal cleavage/methylation domain-containing protein [Patescibacteria group bacterium]